MMLVTGKCHYCTKMLHSHFIEHLSCCLTLRFVGGLAFAFHKRKWKLLPDLFYIIVKTFRPLQKSSISTQVTAERLPTVWPVCWIKTAGLEFISSTFSRDPLRAMWYPGSKIARHSWRDTNQILGLCTITMDSRIDCHPLIFPTLWNMESGWLHSHWRPGILTAYIWTLSNFSTVL